MEPPINANKCKTTKALAPICGHLRLMKCGGLARRKPATMVRGIQKYCYSPHATRPIRLDLHFTIGNPLKFLKFYQPVIKVRTLTSYGLNADCLGDGFAIGHLAVSAL